MFTGIIEELGTVRKIARLNKDASLSIESTVCSSDAAIGDSISVNGACLTLTGKDHYMLSFDLSSETLTASNLADLKIGEKVNLERALKLAGRLGGHYVTGHVDYVAKVLSKIIQGDFIELEIELPDEFRMFLVDKGSVAVDGISLTVNSVSAKSFKVMVIPHTLSVTALGLKKKGSLVNIETDILAKYAQNLIIKTKSTPEIRSYVDKDFLAKHGFA